MSPNDGRWTKRTLDGFGRVKKVESGTETETKSIVETEYAQCACSAIGKVRRVSQPYLTGTPVWTTYNYDGLGRTVSVQAADGASTTTYVYEGNTVKVTDPAGKWKKMTLDAFGQITQVEEPNPAGGSFFNLLSVRSRGASGAGGDASADDGGDGYTGADVDL